MKVRPKQHYQARARIAKALAHPSRLLILDALADGEICVCELTPLVGADQSTVSKHLAMLKAVGLVEDRREGVKIFYRCRCACIGGFWRCLGAVLKDNVKAQTAALRT